MIKKKDILIIIAILFLISSMILPKNLGDLDEIWNYNFASNISEGRLPYKDFNMLQTPLLPMISSLFLKLFGNELIVMRILAIILCTVIFFLVYKILEKRLNVNTYASLAITLFILYLFQEHVRIDYNFAVLTIVLILIYLELKPSTNIIEVNTKRDFIIGVLAGSTILFKQTTGIAITVVAIGYKLLAVQNKEQFKIWIKSAGLRLLGVCIPIVCLVIYISIFQIWEEFIDYTILGVKTFSNSLSYKHLLENGNWKIKILSVILPIFLIIQYILGVVRFDKSEKNKNYLTLFSYSIASCVVIFPITDEIHFLVGMLPCMIGMFTLIYELLSKILKGKLRIFIKCFINSASVGMLVFYIIVSIKPLKEYIQNANKYTNLQHFRYIPISEALENQINEIDNYIEKSDKEVYILDATASVYMIPINRYNKNYDMFLKGNLGVNGEEGIINELEEKENIKVLIMKEGLGRNWQNPEEVRKYIQEDWQKTDEIACFEIYEK